MKKDEIITSGILEAYVLRIATPEEIGMVEDHLSDPEVVQELNQIHEVLADLSLSMEKEVPVGVKSNLDKLLFGEELNATERETAPEVKVIQLPSSGSNLRWLSMAASVAVLISVGLNLFQFASYKEVKGKMAELESSNTVLASEVKVVRQDLGVYGAITDFFQNGDIKTIELTAVNNKEGKAMLYCDMKSGMVAVKPSDLPALSDDYQYQLWALIDGVPVDMGMIPNNAVGKDQLAMLKSVKGMQAFAITKEEFGGKPSPTLSEMVVMGKVV